MLSRAYVESTSAVHEQFGEMHQCHHYSDDQWVEPKVREVDLMIYSDDLVMGTPDHGRYSTGWLNTALTSPGGALIVVSMSMLR